MSFRSPLQQGLGKQNNEGCAGALGCQQRRTLPEPCAALRSGSPPLWRPRGEETHNGPHFAVTFALTSHQPEHLALHTPELWQGITPGPLQSDKCGKTMTVAEHEVPKASAGDRLALRPLRVSQLSWPAPFLPMAAEPEPRAEGTHKVLGPRQVRATSCGLGSPVMQSGVEYSWVQVPTPTPLDTVASGLACGRGKSRGLQGRVLLHPPFPSPPRMQSPQSCISRALPLPPVPAALTPTPTPQQAPLWTWWRWRAMIPIQTPGPPSAPPSSTSATSRRPAAGGGCTWWGPAPASTTRWPCSATTPSQVGGTGPGAGRAGCQPLRRGLGLRGRGHGQVAPPPAGHNRISASQRVGVLAMGVQGAGSRQPQAS